ncbi:hypothetical protein N836_28705 [Leptolyngbya sp. Heron Island J]|nr:hypothetical protein N836_28705 [Leptolyngbya sp. Heron Island J]
MNLYYKVPQEGAFLVKKVTARHFFWLTGKRVQKDIISFSRVLDTC